MEGKLNIIALVAVIGLIAVTLTLAMIKPVERGDADTMTVSGTAELSVSPDKAEIYVNVITEADNAQKAQEDNKVIADKVMKALKSAGLKDEDIETSNYQLNKKVEWVPKEQTTVEKGYILTRTLKITTTKIEEVGNIVDAAIKAGANGVERVTFGLNKETEKNVRAQALTKATQAAKDKAANMAQAAGITLGKISGIQESNFYYVPFEANVKNTIAGGASDASQSIIPPSKVDITGTVQVTYRIK